MNFGQGDVPLYACPSVKSAPLPEYSTVLSVSAPIAFDAAAMVVRASWATTDDASAATSIAARIILFLIVPLHRRPPATCHLPMRPATFQGADTTTRTPCTTMRL